MAVLGAFFPLWIFFGLQNGSFMGETRDLCGIFGVCRGPGGRGSQRVLHGWALESGSGRGGIKTPRNGIFGLVFDVLWVLLGPSGVGNWCLYLASNGV